MEKNKDLTELEMQTGKEKFEPLEMKEVDVKVEKGYATSGRVSPLNVPSWGNGSW